MSDQGLMAVTPLGGFAETIGNVAITEPAGLSLVAVAPSRGGQAALDVALKDAFGLGWPITGQSTVNDDLRLMGMSPDQAFLLFAHAGPNAVAAVRGKLGEVGWLTDQSDSWAMLRVSGTDCRLALARLCMLDLHSNVFGIGAAQRTTMEHLAVIIVRESEDTFLLMSPTSSAESFLDAVVTSARNIVPAKSAGSEAAA